MIIYMVAGDNPQKLKYKAKYKHALFTFGAINNTELERMIKRRNKWLSKKGRK